MLSASFRRVASHPGGPFYSDGARCGGAALDLHIHDTDFVQYCFGMPTSVTSFGMNPPRFGSQGLFRSRSLKMLKQTED